MTKAKPLKPLFPSGKIANDQVVDRKDTLSKVTRILQELRQHVSKLSYEDSLKELDLLLSDLQDENLPVMELQTVHLKAQIYFQHCELLLDNIEQEIVQLEPEELTSLSDK